MIPHITKSYDGSDWCVHYAGFSGPDLKRKTHCRAGVEYATVETKVEFTSSSKNNPRPYHNHSAHPCFKSDAHLTGGCSKCQYRTAEEVAKDHADILKSIADVGRARKAIVADLEKRHADKDRKVTFNAESNQEVEDGPTNFVSGSGIIICPICTTGSLRYSRAGYNGHVHARCSTDGCVAWME